jgi:hypothetical protein
MPPVVSFHLQVAVHLQYSRDISQFLIHQKDQ